MRRRWTFPALAALLTVAAAGGLFFLVNGLVTADRVSSYSNQVEDFQGQVSARLIGYERILDGAQRLAVSYNLNQSAWNNYFNAINFSDYPGLSSISFSDRVKAAGVAAYQSQFYKIFPAADKPEYLPVTYMSPLTAELRPFLGFDSSSVTPDQYRWVQTAIATGQKQRTDAYNFTADPRIFGMFMVSPIYDVSADLSGAGSRNQAYTGVLIASFKVNDLVSVLTSLSGASSFADIQIYDKPGGRKIYDRQPTRQIQDYPYHGSFQATLANRPLFFEVGANSAEAGGPLSHWWLVLILPLAMLAAFIAHRWQLEEEA